jgi:hypothetical protein
MGTTRIKYIIAIFALSILSTGILRCGGSTKNIVGSRVAQPPVIDGILTEETWMLAVPATGFSQYDPDEGMNATEETVVKILYDDNALYIGVICSDSDPSGIVEQLTRRDRTVQGDRFSVIIDSYNDNSTAFLFSGAISGVQSDGLLSHDGLVYDVQWDAVWEFKARIQPFGWSAEFKIPYGALRFSDQTGEYVWGINFRRYIARKQETDEWVLAKRNEVTPGTISSVSKMGNLSGIVNIHPPLHIELLPYGVARENFLAQPSPFKTRQEFKPNIGIDLKYGVSNNFMLDLAVNPDFGQVEVDQANLNLTVFETYYPEKRPFFLEGSQIFSFGNSFDNSQLRLLYSRRIGKQPSGYDYIYCYDSLVIGNNATFREKPEATTILAAGKISGRTNDGLDIGVLSAVTDREEAVIEGINGVHSPDLMVEPRASYTVARVRQNIGQNSTVGAMVTGSFKERNFPSFSGGTDWKLRTEDGMYGFDGYVAGSALNNSSGSAGRFALGKIGGENWIVFSSYDYSTKKFFIDDLGFYSQAREHGGYLAVSYKEDHAVEPFRRYGVTLQSQRRWDWNGIGTLANIELEPAFEFRNFWQLTLDYIHSFPAYDDENTLSYGSFVPTISLYRRPAADELSATLRTDSRRMVVVSWLSQFMTTANGAKTYLSSLQATIRPVSWMEFVPGITGMVTTNEEAWLIGYYNADGYARFGERNVNYYDFSLRQTFTFSPDMSLQFFGQLLAAKWRYRNIKDLISPTDFIVAADQPGPIEYCWKVLNANIVFRWEYLPGSTLYLVWTQGRDGYLGAYSQSFSRDLGDIFRIPMNNVFLAKITYWWSL